MENIIGKKLRFYRKKSHYSLEEVKGETGIPIEQILEFEEGQEIPSIEELIKFQKLYNVKLEDLINEKINFKYCDDDDESFDEVDLVNDEKEKVNINIGPTIKEKDFDFKFYKNESLLGSFILIIGLFVVTIIYLTLGFVLKDLNIRNIYWILYFIPFILSSFVDTIESRKLYKFNITFLVTFIYLLVGYLTSIWHPTRILFLGIPLFYLISDAIIKWQIKY